MKQWATVARCGAVGDNLMAASCLPLLKRHGYMVEVLTMTPNHVVFEHNPYIDKLSVIDGRDLPVDEPIAWQKWFQDRGKQSDVFVHLAHSIEMVHALLPEQSAFYWPLEVRRKFCAGNYLESIHDIAGVPYEFGPLFFTSNEEREQALATRVRINAHGQRVIGWVLRGTRIDRYHPHTAIAIARVIKELDAVVIMTAAPTPDNFKFAREVLDEVVRHNGNDQGLHLAVSPDGSLTWSLRRALSQLLFCDLVIGPDTGPMWAVAFEQMPKVSLLSNQSAENVTKHWINTITLHAGSRVSCYPCHRLHADKSTCVPNSDDTGAKCISDISVETIVMAVKNLLMRGAEDAGISISIGER
jgi:ADP-heptose:LPS heptosyltransferase